MESVITTSDYKNLLESIRHAYGYDFTDYTESSVRRRISHFIESRGLESVQVLATRLLASETFFEEFVQELSVTVTEMFRDPAFFLSIRTKVMKRLATYPVIRIWIAGCATGEEVYSIAIMLREEGLSERSVIYATDINQKSLQIAKEGIYPLESMRTYTENYLQAGGKNSFSNYYTANYNSALFDKSLRGNVVFSPHNLAADGSFNEFQLIICRNVLMYFNQDLQQRVLALFHESLCNFGFLGIGHKESIYFSDARRFFEETDRQEKIYMKIK